MVPPVRIAERIASASALREPQIPLSIDGGVVQPEDGILRRRFDTQHMFPVMTEA